MARRRIEFELRAGDDELSRGWKSVEKFLQAHECSQRVRYVAALVFEEAVSNIFERAASPPPECRIEIELGPAGDDAVMVFSDPGAPFDPCAVPPPRRPESLQDAPAGGRGIHLMRQMSRSMSYSRVNGRNRLEIRFGEASRATP